MNKVERNQFWVMTVQTLLEGELHKHIFGAGTVMSDPYSKKGRNSTVRKVNKLLPTRVLRINEILRVEFYTSHSVNMHDPVT
jgi:hypothetical protein